MSMANLASLGVKHARTAVAEALYLQTGRDITRPVTFYGIVNEHCNVKCRYCEYWRLKHYATEMTIAEWRNALKGIKDWLGTFSINFSGGEPFIKPGFLDLLGWCKDNGIYAGVTTNGSALTERNAEKVVAAHPFNVNISVDAPTAELHDYLRGYPGLFKKLSSGIRFLVEKRQAAGTTFPIVIKPTINSRNFHVMPDMVEWAKSMGATCVSFQPVDRWTPETYEELWIEQSDLPRFEQVVERLIAMVRAREPILTPTHILALMPDHFREKKAPPDVMPCRVGLRNFFIRTDGDVYVCVHGFPPIGNLKAQTAREIWYGEKAQQVRHDTVACEKLCLITCLSQKKFTDKVKMATRLFT
jgi:MoaA/NifB/PqqE/SkfB family radical SAM enzyme